MPVNMLLAEGFKHCLKRFDIVCLFIFLSSAWQVSTKHFWETLQEMVRSGGVGRRLFTQFFIPSKATLPRSGIQINFKDTCCDYLI